MTAPDPVPAGTEAPWLSICIPTYNFGAFIGETLASIARQDLTGVEVVILDGGSTDQTAAVVEGFRGYIPRLTYVRRAARGGIDRDIELAVENATGDMVWTFSADDIMVEGVVRRLAERIPHGDDIILCETMLCDIRLNRPRRYLNSRERRERSFQLADSGERSVYLQLAVNTQALFSFCGALIFKRRRWIASPYDGTFIGSCWSHVVRLLALLPGGLRVRHIPEAWSRKRGDNDSFAERGILNRVRIGIDGYLAIAEHCFGAGSPEHRQVKRLLRAEYTLRVMLAQKSLLYSSGHREDISVLLGLDRRIRGEATVANWFSRGVLLLTPARLLVGVRNAIRWCRRRGIQEAGR
jgi:abequosyltransferase